jgi:hypothetical protein
MYMERKKIGLRLLIVITLILNSGCKNEEKEWEQIQTSNSKTEIENFINDFPESHHLADAKELLSYSKLTNDSTMANYVQFINQYPSSKKLAEIEKRLNDLKADSAYKVAVEVNSISVFDDFLNKFPESKKVGNAKEKLGNLIIPNLVPDWVVVMKGEFVIDEDYYSKHKKETSIPVDKLKPGGTWYGINSQYSFSGFSLEWIMPNPKEQKVVLLILDNNRLPTTLQMNKAYLWRGGKNFIFIKDVNPNLDTEDLLKQLGLKNHGIPRFRAVLL